MIEYKREKMMDELKKYISQFIQTESNKTSMITVTNIDLSKDLKKARFFVTVFPENEEVAALDFLERNQKNAKEYLKEKSKLSRIPFVTFHLDNGEKSRQHLDEISRSL
ncbi:ribosome-binding factor A [Candidatus Nomurabacteria bacterium]|nr:ribosome-binding factor A [Candidatus Nomurabacteria bacterium]